MSTAGLDRMPALASRFRVQQRGLVAWTFGLDAVRFTGPGTDLTLVPDATWQISELTGPRGRPNVLNLPTEEIYTTPDWRRASGTVTTTTTTPPLAPGGVLIDRFTLRIEEGVVTDAAAEHGESTILAQLGADEGARRLGEVASLTTPRRSAAAAPCSARPFSTRTPPATSPGAPESHRSLAFATVGDPNVYSTFPAGALSLAANSATLA